MDKVPSSIELKTSQRIENAFSTFFGKKWVKICLTICILKYFFVFEDF